tara:strand:+ start:287 stop:769 length:483 start_codon:yes stop_codon:yes gene_type:complete
MVASIDLQQKPKTLKSKYHQFKNKLESSYGAIRGTVSSKLDQRKQKVNDVRNSLNKLIEKSSSPYLEKPILKIRINIKTSTTAKDIKTNYEESIDWTRGRIKGELIQVIIKEGVIVEKAFITPKGSLIIVKRHELGLFNPQKIHLHQLFERLINEYFLFK